MVRSCLFTAQATARDMRKAGREKEMEEIRELIDTVAPPLPESFRGWLDKGMWKPGDWHSPRARRAGEAARFARPSALTFMKRM